MPDVPRTSQHHERSGDTSGRATHGGSWRRQDFIDPGLTGVPTAHTGGADPGKDFTERAFQRHIRGSQPPRGVARTSQTRAQSCEQDGRAPFPAWRRQDFTDTGPIQRASERTREEAIPSLASPGLHRHGPQSSERAKHAGGSHPRRGCEVLVARASQPRAQRASERTYGRKPFPVSRHTGGGIPAWHNQDFNDRTLAATCHTGLCPALHLQVLQRKLVGTARTERQRSPSDKKGNNQTETVSEARITSEFAGHAKRVIRSCI